MAIEGISNTNQNIYEFKSISANNSADIKQQFNADFLQSTQKSKSIEQHFINQNSPFQNHFEGTIPSVANTVLLTVSDVKKPTDISINSSDLISDKIAINQSKESFVKSVWPYACQLAHMIGLDPKVLLAQAALETGWGKFIAKAADGSSSNNLFNIKALENSIDSVQINTTEYFNKIPYKTQASFKTYESINASLIDYITLMQNNPRYQTAFANTADPQRYLTELQKAGYATDPNYAAKILQIYQGKELEQALKSNLYM